MRSMIAKVTALSLGLALCLSGMALASSAELIAAAKKEGKLRLITFPSFKKTAEGFEKKYGIKVEGHLRRRAGSSAQGERGIPRQGYSPSTCSARRLGR